MFKLLKKHINQATGWLEVHTSFKQIQKSWCTMMNAIYIIHEDRITKWSHDKLSHNRYIRQKKVIDIPNRTITISIYKRKGYISICTQTNTYHTDPPPMHTLLNKLPQISLSKKTKITLYKSLILNNLHISTDGSSSKTSSSVAMIFHDIETKCEYKLSTKYPHIYDTIASLYSKVYLYC